VLPKKLKIKIDQREHSNSLRKLGTPNHLIDFSSNDYLGFSKNKNIFSATSEILKRHNLELNGATGSRLLTGNHALYGETETIIATFHNTEKALIFNSGYDANLGFFGSVPQRGDVILYDELCHASIRDGIKMSNANAFKFTHNDIVDIENQLSARAQSRTTNQELYLVTESIFSMDGDQPDLKALVQLCKKYKAHLIVDEAHAVGVFGKKGEGLIQALGLEKDVFARIVTFGKALGCHGAAILGSKVLKSYLVNFARSFIYTTGLPPHSIATVLAAYDFLISEKGSDNQLKLMENISYFKQELKANGLQNHFIESNSAIQCMTIPGNIKVKAVSQTLRDKGFDVKPILSPTVTIGEERLRFCLHAFNTKEEIRLILNTLTKNV